jgi:CRP-like cAMP-binding protein
VQIDAGEALVREGDSRDAMGVLLDQPRSASVIAREMIVAVRGIPIDGIGDGPGQ